MVTTPQVAGTEHWTVSHLIDSSTNTWKHDVVRTIFNNVDAENILNMPLPCVTTEDTPIWKLSRNGTYSVKSAYYGVMERLADSSHLKVEGDWMQVWKLKVPPKVKLFTWRVLRGVLPTRVRLNGRGVNCPTHCTFCEVGEENDWHVFFGCDKAKSIWRTAGLEHTVTTLSMQVEDTKELIFSMVKAKSIAQKHDFVMMLWALWKCRNDKVWSNQECDAYAAIVSAKHVLLDWELAKQHRDQPVNVQKPQQGTMKCNVDTAIFMDQRKFGYGMCLRNHRGEFLHAKTMILDGTIKATEAEARGLWEALTWVGNLGYDKVIFELDCKYVVDNISGDTNCQSEVGVVINTCTEKLRQFPNYSVIFVRRKTNSVAHMLARVSKFNASHQYFDYMLACIFDSILKEMD